MSSKLRIGVVGFGKLGAIHARNVNSNSGAILYAVCDTSEEALKAAKNEFPGIAAFASLSSMLEASIDAVIIASNTPLHLEHIQQAAESQKHIFTEKPVGLSIEDTDKVLKIVKTSGIEFQIGFQRRWDPRFLLAKKMISDGKIGKPVLLKAYGRDPNASNPANWGLDKNGGLFLNAAIHDYDVARFLFELEPSSVSASGATLVYKDLAKVNDLDTCSTTIIYGDNEAMSITEWSRYARYGYDIECEIVGTEGMIRIGSEQNSSVLLQQQNDSAPTVFEAFSDAYKGQIDAFIDRIRSNKRVTPGIEDARAALHIALIARESHQLKKQIALSPIAPLDDK